ncbi:MAG: DUF5009 domain-containing protein [Sandaracinus sp.]|nr:DUF5009 domain-containing protein [Sandaracinus sp.]MCB9630714.1 DUF5009 domain-containing protein [Sandaracinus sp.]
MRQDALMATGNEGVGRIRSIDVLRGLAITSMVLVNDAAETAHAPDALRHVPPGIEGMTLADVVFPAFLFVVGLSAPLALTRARAAGQSTAKILAHVLARTFGLLVMGVMMVGRADHVGWMPNLWTGLMYVAFFATWSVVPKKPSWKRHAFRIAKVGGVALLVALAWSYRGADGGRLVLGPLVDPTATEWLHHGWWEILGTLGWVYVTTSLVFLAVGPSPWRLSLGVPVALAAFAFEHAGWLGTRATWPADLGPFAFVGELVLAIDAHVSFAFVLGPKLALALAGAALGSSFVRGRSEDSEVVRSAVVVALVTGLLGLALHPLWGVSKTGSTPSWALYSASLTSLVFAGIHHALARGRLGWLEAALAPAGASPLTAYLLHPLVRGALGLIPGLGVLQAYKGAQASPFVAVLGATAMTVFVVWATGRLARLGVRVEV